MSDPHAYYSPVYLSAPYGARSGGFHHGDDFAHPAGEPVPNLISGTVIEAGPDTNGQLGNRVVVDAGNGTQVIYGHLADRLNVVRGQKISAGDIIGAVGSPDNASVLGEWDGPHTHLAITQNGGFVSPAVLIPTLPPVALAGGGTGGGPTTAPPATSTPQQNAVYAGQAAKKYNVPTAVVLGVLYQESKLQTDPPGGNGGGMGQVEPETAQSYGVTQAQLRANPQLAADTTAHILADNYKAFGDWQKAIGAYFVGPKAISDAGANFKNVQAPGNQGTVGSYLAAVQLGVQPATDLLANQVTGSVGAFPSVVPDAVSSLSDTVKSFYGLLTNKHMYWELAFIIVGLGLAATGGIIYLSSFKEVQSVEGSVAKAV